MPKFFNGTSGPVVYDGYGRFVGGGEWVDVDKKTERIEQLIELGYLVEVVTPSEEANEESAEGQEAPKRNSRSVKK